MEKEFKKDYAVLYKKEIVSEDYLVYLFKPCYVIEGFYDRENNIFLDDLNEERLTFNNPKLAMSDDQFYVGLIFQEDDLLKKFPEARNIGEAKIYLNEESKENAMIGIYDMVNDKINIAYFKLDTLSSSLSSILSKPANLIEPKEEYEDYDNYENYDEDEEYDESVLDFLEEVINELIGSEVYFIELEDIDEILAINDLEQMKEKLFIIKNENDIPSNVLDSTEAKLCIQKNIFEALLESDDIEIIKEKFLQMRKEIGELLFSSDNNKSNYDEIIYGYNLVHDTIMNTSNIDLIKGYLVEVATPFKTLIEQITAYNDEGRFPGITEFSKLYIQETDKLLQYDDIEQIKTGYDKFYKENQALVEEYALEKSFIKQMNEVQEEKKIEKEREVKQKEYEDLFNKEQKPSYRFDYKEVHDKMVARVIGRDMQIDSILTTIERNDKVKNPSKRSAMIIAGTTGTGKTQTFTELRNALADIRPVNIVDTNQITSEGYVGGTIEDNVLASLIMQAHSINEKNTPNLGPGITALDVNLAQHGIVILDEIDKRAEVDGRGDNVNKSGVVHQLLKLMDPSTKYIVKVGKQAVEFDTSFLTIFASGAFQEYFEDTEKRKTKPSLGFATDTQVDNSKSEYEKYNEVDPNELVKYGLDRQFVGRFNRVTLFPSHTKESLLELETNKATSNIQVEIDEYESQGISFLWEDGFLEKAVEKAYDMKTGGRALANIINRSLGNLNVEVNNRKGMFKAVFIPIKALEDSGSIMLVKDNNDTVLLKDLYAESKKRNEELKIINKLVRDDKTYENVKQLYDFVFATDEKQTSQEAKVKKRTK